jgi:hypothetical protein
MEIARVLKPGGTLVLLFRTSTDAQAVRAFPAEVYHFPSLSEALAPLEQAGLALERRDELRGEPVTPPTLIVATKRSTQQEETYRVRIDNS